MSDPMSREPLDPDGLQAPQQPESPSGEPLQTAVEPLVATSVDPWRAALAAVLLVMVTDAFTLGGVALMKRLDASGLPGSIQSAAFGALATLGYLGGLAIAVAITRSRRAGDESPRPPFAADYGFRGLSLTMFGWALIGALAARFAGGLWAVLLQSLNVKLPGMDLDPSALLPRDPVSVTIAFILFVGVAPLVEEIGFRGIMYGSLERRIRPIWANVVTALLFGGLHFNVFGFVPIVIASLVFGVLFQRTRSLWTAVFSHAAFNAMGLTVAYLVAMKPGA